MIFYRLDCPLGWVGAVVTWGDKFGWYLVFAEEFDNQVGLLVVHYDLLYGFGVESEKREDRLEGVSIGILGSVFLGG